MNDWPDHFCPGCGTPQRAFPRYPWYFCQNCLKHAVDGDGRLLKFGNASLSGGLSWRYLDDPDAAWRSDVGTVLCRIKNRPVFVHEARFGGVVAEPLRDVPLGDAPSKVTNLLRPSQSRD